MKNLAKYLFENVFNKTTNILEGGASGHMAHPIDFSFFTAEDLKELIRDIFTGKIEDITEKIDGTNIQATMNQSGEVVFIRNQGDLNSEKGGMSIEDMAEKWKANPSVAETFITAGKTIEKVFKKIGKEFFNPDSTTRIIANCECVLAGVTNIMPYASAQVDFHDLWIYKMMNGRWAVENVTKKDLDKIERACGGVDSAKITPKVIIEITEQSNSMAEKYCDMIDKLFKNDELSIDAWKFEQYLKYIKKDYQWILSNEDGIKILYNRWFNGDKSTNLRLLKQMYPDYINELNDMDKKGYKELMSDVIEPLDTIFLKLGNDVIRLCSGLINGSKNDSVIKRLQNDIKVVTKDIKETGSEDAQKKLIKQLKRLERLGGDQSINSAEGIVFRYKGKLMKLTGSFASVNQILGSIKFSK